MRNKNAGIQFSSHEPSKTKQLEQGSVQKYLI